MSAPSFNVSISCSDILLLTSLISYFASLVKFSVLQKHIVKICFRIISKLNILPWWCLPSIIYLNMHTLMHCMFLIVKQFSCFFLLAYCNRNLFLRADAGELHAYCLNEDVACAADPDVVSQIHQEYSPSNEDCEPPPRVLFTCGSQKQWLQLLKGNTSLCFTVCSLRWSEMWQWQTLETNIEIFSLIIGQVFISLIYCHHSLLLLTKVSTVPYYIFCQ